MNTDGGWISISEAARLYGKSRKWVDNQIEEYGLTTKKVGNKKLVMLADLIAHRGEPHNSAETRNQKSQILAPDIAHQTELLNQEILFLRERITDLENDKADWKAERQRLQTIIERQTLALPTPEQHRGVFGRVMDWWQGVARNL